MRTGRRHVVNGFVVQVPDPMGHGTHRFVLARAK